MRNKLILLFTFVLLASPAWGATQLKKTVKPSGGDYTSLEACMNANEQDLTAADKYFDVEIDGTWSSADTTSVTIHNYTTDSTRYINIYTTGTARHDGTPNKSGAYFLNNAIVVNNGQGTRPGNTLFFDGLSMAYGIQFGDYTSAGGTVKNHLFYGVGPGVSQYDTGGGGAAVVNVFNSIFIRNGGDNYSATLIGIGSAVTAANIYSCTFNGEGNSEVVGLNNYSTFKNCIVFGHGSGRVDFSGTTTTSSDYNTSSDTSAPGANSKHEVTPTFEDEPGKDLHLSSTDTVAKDSGTNTSGESAPLNFTTDIDGDTRSGTWDIGADEYSSSGTTAAQVIIVEEE